eukprot:CAMPEP_0118893756 /NCGR_PEP_ID=MMETSP1166-20130328/2838_1 /TAXON_ID=1104430 /ORGANISM="Chrysoreinhardia sp, Strain CCMP3193" /LENGTH=140 /DNA_ID=CAMNT_0006832605 /DNA_START=183 /DNA_END=601 /DNA_ORIENTATION=+
MSTTTRLSTRVSDRDDFPPSSLADAPRVRGAGAASSAAPAQPAPSGSPPVDPDPRHVTSRRTSRTTRRLGLSSADDTSAAAPPPPPTTPVGPSMPSGRRPSSGAPRPSLSSNPSASPRRSRKKTAKSGTSTARPFRPPSS